MLLLVEVDKRFMLLPDVLTLPLLILGFGYAALNGNWLIMPDPEIMNPAFNSFMGAVFGYVMPTVASMFIVWKCPDAFGGGDIKLLAAIGAWVGFEVVAYVILLSCIIFAGQCLVLKQKAGAFGPAIVYATLILQIFLQGFE
jgi:leader peptidase (prepilin peptidase)/N-methyltransferase